MATPLSLIGSKRKMFKRQMRRAIKERLRPLGMEVGKTEFITAKVMDVARARLVR